MLKLSFKKNNSRKKVIQKVLLTLFILLMYRFGNSIPLFGIDQESLKKSLLQMENRNAIMQIMNMYSGSGSNILTPFSLGIIPFINASILIDLLTALFPALEKLQSEEGEFGRKKLMFYKKLVTLLFATIQSGFLVFYLRPYLYTTELFNLGIIALQLVTGSLLVVWLSNLIDIKGIGNGTSLIIFANIVIGLISKNIFINALTDQFFLFEIFILLILIFFICISQTARVNIEVVSARQLAFLENFEKKYLDKSKIDLFFQLKENGLSIRLNQAGIFPIIIASNLMPFIGLFSNNLGINLNSINSLLYYVLIIAFNYFYTTVFWDPEKISEQLRKASVSIVNITPGKETVSYLENVVRSTSILGGIFLCLILFLYDFIKQLINGPILNQINISSLIILVGVAYEIQRTIRSLYKNIIDTSF
jgi:preprotein translocase subunit SecY